MNLLRIASKPVFKALHFVMFFASHRCIWLLIVKQRKAWEGHHLKLLLLTPDPIVSEHGIVLFQCMVAYILKAIRNCRHSPV